MQNKIGTVAAVVMLGAASGAAGQEDGDPVILARQYVVPSSILGEDRPIAVGLPQRYDSTAAYPVIYVLDGLGHMMHTLASARFLAANERMPEAIVVTIANTAGNRTRDMTPPLTVENGDPELETGGGAAKFQAFIVEELKPWIEERYPTRPYDVLIGHSFGGLFISHVLNTDPAQFDAYISISPSLWWDEERFASSLEDVFERFPEAKGALYMTMGNEGGDMLAGAWRLTSILEKHAPPRFRWHWEHMPTETHGSVPARSTYDGLEWIFSGWHPVELMADLLDEGAKVLPRVEEHYAEVSSEMGWEVKPPLRRVAEAAYRLGERDRPDDALGVAEALASWYPEHPFARFSVGRAHESACRLEEAHTHQTRALRMAEQAERPDTGLVEFLRSRVTALEAKIEAGVCTRR